MKVDRRVLAVKNRQISIRMEQFTDHMVERTGLSTAQAHLLMRILRQGPQGTTLTELHRQCGYSMAALSSVQSAVGAKVPLRPNWWAKLESVQAPRAQTTSRSFSSSEIPPAEPTRMMFSTS